MKRERGFSLVEMLAAITVFALLIVMMAQILGNTSSVILSARKSLDADSQARLVFGMLSRDLGGMLKRQDVDMVFLKGTDNDQMYFFSTSSASSSFAKKDANTVSLVGYRVGVDPQNTKSLELQRLGLGLAWGDTGSGSSQTDNLVFLTYADGTDLLDPQSTIRGRWATAIAAPGDSAYYSTIGLQVFRFEYCFLLNDGTYSNYPVKKNPTATLVHNSAPSAGTGTVGDRWFDENSGRGYICQPGSAGAVVWRSAGVTDVTAIVVALTILDQGSRKVVLDTTTLPPLFKDSDQTKLSVTADAAELMKKTWQNVVDSSGFAATAGIPVPAASNVRVYQRHFYLNNLRP